MKLEHGEYLEASPDALTPGQVRDWTGDETYGMQRIPEGWKRSWNAPTCERCWVQRMGFRQPVRPSKDITERDRVGAHCCAFCGRPTWARIWTRADPAEVPYPMLEELE